MEINIEVEELKKWGLDYKNKFLVAGPCSAESEEQVINTAKALKQYGVNVFRSGVWKLRTRPNTFEGVGRIGLRWLKDVRDEFDLPVAVEVANSSQVEECLKYEIDILWIGARTTPNPLLTKEIAESLQGVDIPVMVKNPLNPDLHMWIGTFERLNSVGITKIMAVHRGFSCYGENIYRNPPLWRIPIELKRLIPNIPIICDPSHICGRTDLILEIAQASMDLLFDGLMVEVHIDPSKALCDTKQQLTPEEFGQLLEYLKIKTSSIENQNFISEINFLRKVIDELDIQIIDLLSERMDISKKIAHHKNRNNISIFQPDRWNEIIKNRTRYGFNKELATDFIFQLFQFIHEESIRQQGKVTLEE